MAEIDVLKAQIFRSGSEPWGFRIQGGVDYGKPITIQRITPGTPAAKIGLKSGDNIVEISGVSTDNLTLAQVENYIRQHGDNITLTVERKAQGNVPLNPDITPDAARPHTVKGYQTFNMSDPGVQNKEMQIARSRPFVPPSNRRVDSPDSSRDHQMAQQTQGLHISDHPQSQPLPQQQTQYSPNYNEVEHVEVDSYGRPVQSYSFNKLQQFMEMEDPKNEQNTNSGPKYVTTKPFNAQFNTPKGLYSEETIREMNGLPPLPGNEHEEKAYLTSDTYRYLLEMEEEEKSKKPLTDANVNKPTAHRDSRQSFKDRINRDDVKVKLASNQYSCLSQKRAYKDRIVDRTEAKDWTVPRGSVQSRTFNKLQEMLDNGKESSGKESENNNEEKPTGSLGVAERCNEEISRGRKSGPRVKVFMPQQYNTPIGMYSAQNVMETFTDQAEGILSTLERQQKHENVVTEVFDALKEHEQHLLAQEYTDMYRDYYYQDPEVDTDIMFERQYDRFPYEDQYSTYPEDHVPVMPAHDIAEASATLTLNSNTSPAHPHASDAASTAATVILDHHPTRVPPDAEAVVTLNQPHRGPFRGQGTAAAFTLSL